MTVRVGVIGVGMIGEDHVRRLTEVVAGAKVIAVTDLDQTRAAAVAKRLPGARVHDSGPELVANPDVDAVIVASWGQTHEEQVLACLAAGKPVFCEKPLATREEGALRIVNAEVAHGRRLVQVGFMRRYDAAYRALKQTVESGAISAPLLMHCAHRNPSLPPNVTTEMVIHDSAVHEVDLARWLFDEEVVATQVLAGRRSSHAADVLADPFVVVLEMAGGVLVDVELSLNIGYGYDIRAEVVGESGTVALSDDSMVTLSSAGHKSGRVPADWRERFVQAYDAELQEWVNAVDAGESTGPTAWDGYAASVVVNRTAAAFESGERNTVPLVERPGFYAQDL